jgi:hypothetical protein
MYPLRLEVSDDRLRAAIEAHRDTLLECPWTRVLTMAPEELRRIVEELVVTMLAAEIDWLDERHLPCNIRVTADEHVFLIDFATRADALLFQETWGGELCDGGAALVH